MVISKSGTFRETGRARLREPIPQPHGVNELACFIYPFTDKLIDFLEQF
jgi:hypothetical protein